MAPVPMGRIIRYHTHTHTHHTHTHTRHTHIHTHAQIAGRVGDSPIPGSGCYVDSEVGGAAATGDGDIMMRFAPSLQAVLYMKQGMSVLEACNKSIQSIFQKFSTFSGGMVCVGKGGEHAGVAVNMQFSYSYMAGNMDQVLVVPVA